MYSVNSCYENHYSGTILEPFSTGMFGLFLAILTVLILVGWICNKRKMFDTNHSHSGNPYKLIYRVLKFAHKNKHPGVGRKAETYCDEKMPQRIDFAKNRFGGPFKDSDVEDVKTFFRLLYLLSTFVPIFILELPVSQVAFSIFTLHTGTAATSDNSSCSAQWVLLGGGVLGYCTPIVFLPLYIYLMFSTFRNRTPRMVVRIGMFSFLFTLAVASLLVIDSTGHWLSYTQNQTRNISCMFTQSIIPNQVDVPTETLNMHWAVLIVPNLLIGIAPNLLLASLLEFISAQTPHTMKGLMVGVLFALRGLSRFLSALLIAPFSLSFWVNYQPVSPGISCVTGYYLVLVTFSIIGFVWFVSAAYRYTYRVRNEEEFSQYVVERVVGDYLERRDQLRTPLLVEMPYPEDDGFSIEASTRVEPSERKQYGAIQKMKNSA